MERPADGRLLISVVSPAYCEELGIDAFYERLDAMTKRLAGFDWEFVLVDDGSTDATFDRITALADSDHRIRALRLSRNFGHQLAITCGLDHASGDAVVVIDSDLQDPPEVIPKLIEAWEAGADVAYGKRGERMGETRFKRLSAAAYYRTLRGLTDVDIPVDAGDFRLMDRRVVDALGEMREENRYVRGLIGWVGFTQVPVAYDRDPRHSGTTKYSLFRMLRLAGNGVTAFSEKPLRIASLIGAMVLSLTALGALYTIVSRLLFPSYSDPGFATIILLIMFFGSIQLLSIGLLGEYVGRLYREAKGRPLYLVKDDVKAGSNSSTRRQIEANSTHEQESHDHTSTSDGDPDPTTLRLP